MECHSSNKRNKRQRQEWGNKERWDCKTKAQRELGLIEKDRQREMMHYLCRVQQENLSGLPSPSRARWAITVMSASTRVTSCIYSINDV